MAKDKGVAVAIGGVGGKVSASFTLSEPPGHKDPVCTGDTLMFKATCIGEGRDDCVFRIDDVYNIGTARPEFRCDPRLAVHIHRQKTVKVK